MGKKFVVGLAVVAFLMISGIARADFFESPPGYMDASWWTEIAYDDGPPYTALTDVADVLEFTSIGSEGGYDAFRCYTSGWRFLTDEDFSFSVNYHYSHTGTYDNDEAGIEMGLYYMEPDAEDPSLIMSIGADNWSWYNDEDEFIAQHVYWTGIERPDDPDDLEAEGWWNRYATDGLFYAYYDSEDEELQLYAVENFGDGGDPDWQAVGGGSYSIPDIDQLGVHLGGWSEGAEVKIEEAYFYNFQVEGGTMTPEPVSSVLFLVGGISLVAARLRRRKK